jgi:hypothetical protein
MNDQYFALQVGAVAKIIKRLHKSALKDDELAEIDALIEQIPRRSDYRLIEQLAAVIQMMMFYPNGLNMLLGRVKPPAVEQINDIILVFTPAGNDLGTKVEGGSNIPYAERLIYTAETFSEVVAVCGGWAHIVEVTKSWLKVYPNSWGVVLDYTRWVKTKNTRIDGSVLKKIANLHGYSTTTVLNIINSFPRELADAILMSPRDGQFDLRAVDSYPAI